MRVKKKFVCLIAIFVCILGLSSCVNNTENNRVYAVFELEGGTCQNSTKPVRYGYPIGEDDQVYIVDPNELSDKDIQRYGYKIEGWYTTKNSDGTYSDKWDFSKRTMTSDGITLYARWLKEVSHKIEICYMDGNEEVVLKSYEANEQGIFFKDLESYYKAADSARSGYTCIQLSDADGNRLTQNIVSPLGDEDTVVKVYATFIEGDFKRVYNADNLSWTSNMYLMNDIDMAGKTIPTKDYNRTLLGNGYKISNTKIEFNLNKMPLEPYWESDSSTTSAIYFSLFNTLRNARIENVEFENVEYVIDVTYSRVQLIYFVPLAKKLENSFVSNVSISGNVKYTTNIELEEKMNQAFLGKDSASSVENISLNITINN